MRDLKRMGVADQAIRGDANLRAGDGMEKQAIIDEANMARLAEIIERFGWPGIRFGGAETAAAAFMILQHADTGSQRRYLPLLRDAAARADASMADLSMLEDRLLVADGRPQRYGTQFKSTKPLIPHPIEDEAGLEQRRQARGLPPMADYVEAMRTVYQAD